MLDTREITSLRKQGRIDEALKLAIDLYELNKNDKWAISAYAWCLYAKIKNLIADNNYPDASKLSKALERLPIDASDDILYSSVQRAILNVNPNRKILKDAKTKSEEGKHEEAIAIYKQAKTFFPEDTSIDESIAWEIYKLKKAIFEVKPITILEAKKVLAEYIKLSNPRPSIIHSIFLRLGDKIIDGDSFNSIQFLKLWDLNNLRAEDFEPNVYEGKSYPSLGEKVIQHSAKAIIEKKLVSEIDYFLPFLEMGIRKFKDNIWLNYYKVKFLQLAGKNSEALKFVIPIAKLKSDEFWTWGLLGELYLEIDKKKSLGCFCKALLCKSEEKFLGNIRIRLAQLQIEDGKFNEAKYEIDSAIKGRLAEGYKISTLLNDFTNQEWYKNAIVLSNNLDFYKLNKKLAEEILFEDLPWIKINLGEQYTSPEKPDKPRRKIYAAFSETKIEELSISEGKLKGQKNKNIGSAFQMKAEKDKEGKTKVYLIEPRESTTKFDILPRYIGNITKVKRNDKNLVEAINFVFLEGDNLVEWNTKKIELFDKSKLNVGEPIKVAVSIRLKEEKTKFGTYYLSKSQTKKMYDIHELSYRSDAELFDTIPDKNGVIDHINQEKGIIHFVINKKISGIVKKSICSEELKIGDMISVKVIEVKGDKGNYFQGIKCNKTTEEIESGLKRKFTGEFKGNDKFGFADDVYIPAALINNKYIESGDIISGEAVVSYNKKKDQWGWTAFSVS